MFHSYLFVNDLSLFGRDLFQDQIKSAKYHPVISANFALWQMENYLTLPALNGNKSLVIIIPSARLMLCEVILKTNKQTWIVSEAQMDLPM